MADGTSTSLREDLALPNVEVTHTRKARVFNLLEQICVDLEPPTPSYRQLKQATKQLEPGSPKPSIP